MNNTNACSEVLDILKYIPLTDYQKIPPEIINQLMRNANEKNTFAYNAALPFDQQKISPEAKETLRQIAKEYW